MGGRQAQLQIEILHDDHCSSADLCFLNFFGDSTLKLKHPIQSAPSDVTKAMKSTQLGLFIMSCLTDADISFLRMREGDMSVAQMPWRP